MSPFNLVKVQLQHDVRLKRHAAAGAAGDAAAGAVRGPAQPVARASSSPLLVRADGRRHVLVLPLGEDCRRRRRGDGCGRMAWQEMVQG